MLTVEACDKRLMTDRHSTNLTPRASHDFPRFFQLFTSS